MSISPLVEQHVGAATDDVVPAGLADEGVVEVLSDPVDLAARGVVAEVLPSSVVDDGVELVLQEGLALQGVLVDLEERLVALEELEVLLGEELARLEVVVLHRLGLEHEGPELQLADREVDEGDLLGLLLQLVQVDGQVLRRAVDLDLLLREHVLLAGLAVPRVVAVEDLGPLELGEQLRELVGALEGGDVRALEALGLAAAGGAVEELEDIAVDLVPGLDVDVEVELAVLGVEEVLDLEVEVLGLDELALVLDGRKKRRESFFTSSRKSCSNSLWERFLTAYSVFLSGVKW